VTKGIMVGNTMR